MFNNTYRRNYSDPTQIINYNKVNVNSKPNSENQPIDEQISNLNSEQAQINEWNSLTADQKRRRMEDERKAESMGLGSTSDYEKKFPKKL
jgi:predicted DNA-binding WGR domain protein